MPNFNSIGLGISEPQVAENRYLPLTGGVALTTAVYPLTYYTVMNCYFYTGKHKYFLVSITLIHFYTVGRATVSVKATKNHKE